MSKHEELHELIVGDKTFDLTASECLGAKIALQWLDQNPDQVPGRTITHSEYRFYANELEEGNMSVAGLLGRLDFDIVPDPEPTNAEKLKTVLGDLNRGFLGYSLDNLVRTLDEAGVKAPDHD